MTTPSKEKIKEITEKVTAAKHMSNPEKPNTQTLYDKDGNWILEIYTVGHKIV